MAGLLSVSWHMNQRDLQVSSLGVAQALGGRDKWRSSLLRAFDNWKRDFDDTLADSIPHRGYRNFLPQLHMDEEDTFENRMTPTESSSQIPYNFSARWMEYFNSELKSLDVSTINWSQIRKHAQTRQVYVRFSTHMYQYRTQRMIYLPIHNNGCIEF